MTAPPAPSLSAPPCAGCPPRHPQARASPCARPLGTVEILSVDRAPALPGTTLGGSNEHVVCGGRLPLAHASVTSVLYAPPCGVTVTTCVLVCPAASETLDGETSTAKSVTTICRSAASEKLSPLLLADTLMVDEPTGHVIVDPGAVPHPPVQFNAVNGHRFASTNPSCAAVRLAPNVVLPSTVSTVADPRHAGRVAFSEAKASARPKPDALSGSEPLRGIARPRIKSRTVLRAPAGATVEAVRPSRHGALCSSSAAMPPMCGAAAEVPKKLLLNPPAPVIDTPSIAATSGFTRPSSVGPRLLKNSGVTFDVSRQDSSGAEEKLPAAAADAEQTAPTAITATGDPPASPWAETLRVAVL